MDSLCAVCGKDAPYKCETCDSIFYCGEACQAKDGPLHKLLCQEIKSFLETRPSPHDSPVRVFRLGLKFPKKSALPELVWIPCKLQISPVGKAEWSPDLRASLDCDIQSLFIKKSESCRFGSRVLIGQMPHPEDDDDAEYEENMALRTLLAGKKSIEPCIGEETVPNSFDASLRGPYVALAYGPQDPDGGYVEYRDMTLADLRHVIQHLAQEVGMFASLSRNPFVIFDEKDWVQAVHVECQLEGKSRKKRYRQITISKKHSIFAPAKRSKGCKVTQAMGFPLRLQFGPGSPCLETCSPWDLQLEALTPSGYRKWVLGEGYSPYEHPIHKSVLVVRCDENGTPGNVMADQVEALTDFGHHSEDSCLLLIDPALINDPFEELTQKQFKPLREAFQEWFIDYTMNVDKREDMEERNGEGSISGISPFAMPGLKAYKGKGKREIDLDGE
ncbi:hypothetical protein HYFRA_00009046 [Hymenoscyphus fraxineus]|uniref:MYND-type domain-containing protein n=1 Tax=Hymenoscyphus fraxineus TaxID=746836 RepID=A0A9N9KTG0_9HELO|nr:hypothetical protein HYFRA_00009046 [Hymenoscyphus fraxineus]